MSDEQYKTPSASGHGEQFDNWFVYHAPTPDQIPKYNELRDAAKVFAETIMRLVPDGQGRHTAMTLLRLCNMQANAEIACEVKGP